MLCWGLLEKIILVVIKAVEGGYCFTEELVGWAVFLFVGMPFKQELLLLLMILIKIAVCFSDNKFWDLFFLWYVV